MGEVLALMVDFLNIFGDGLVILFGELNLVLLSEGEVPFICR